MIINPIKNKSTAEINKTSAVALSGNASYSTDRFTINEITSMPDFFCIVIVSGGYRTERINYPLCLIKNGSSKYALAVKMDAYYGTTYYCKPYTEYNFTYTCDSNGLVITLPTTMTLSSISRIYCYWS